MLTAKAYPSETLICGHVASALSSSSVFGCIRFGGISTLATVAMNKFVSGPGVVLHWIFDFFTVIIQSAIVSISRGPGEPTQKSYVSTDSGVRWWLLEDSQPVIGKSKVNFLTFLQLASFLTNCCSTTEQMTGLGTFPI